ncbi:MAG: EF-hand domain-containing protein [bacterium]
MTKQIMKTLTLIFGVSLLATAPAIAKPGHPGGPGRPGQHGGPSKPGGAPPAPHFLGKFDTNGDKQVTMDEWHAGWNGIFKQANTSGDIFIDKAEAKAAGDKWRAQFGFGGGPGNLSPREKFKAMDSNGDAKISKDEWKGPPEIFARFDKNGDGSITPDELPAGGPGGKGGEGAGPGEKLKQMDTNGDGKISKDEWKGPPQMFDRLDANHDGNLSQDELQAARDKTPKGGEGKGTADADFDSNFGNIDSDHDGKLSNKEFNDWAHKLFGKLDRNGDGVLSEADHPPQGTKPDHGKSRKP